MPRARDPLLRQVGERVRHAREHLGWSQERLAEEAGVDRSYMSGIERGARNVSVLKLARIAAALSTPLRNLIP